MYMFGAIDGYFLKPLPFAGSSRLIHLELSNASQGRRSIAVPPHDFIDWQASQRSVESLAGFYQGTINVSGNERPERFDGAFVSSNTLTVLGVQPLMGRLFLPGEDQPGAQPVVILGYDLWKNRYGADRGIIGKVIRVNAKNAVVVGVMPPGFEFPVQEDLWVPLTLDVKDTARDKGSPLEVFGRLRKGVTLEQARADFGNIVARLAKEYPDTNAGFLPVVKPYADEFIGDAKPQIYTMFVSVLLVLLIACANVANITLVRSIARRREFALRSALGADRWRLIVQILTESITISVVAGTLAYLIANTAGAWTVAMLKNNPDIAPPYWVDIGTDWRTVLFACTIALISGVVAGLFPALRASRIDLTSSLHQGGYSVAQPLGRTSRILITAQIALSCILLISAGLMTRSIINMQKVDVGAKTDNVLTARIGLMEANYPGTESRVHFFEALVDRLSGLPGLKAATVSSSLPGSFSGSQFYTPDSATQSRKGRPPLAHVVVTAPNYFRVFEIPVLNGRSFDSRDKKGGQSVAIVNKMLAEKWWPGKDPIGHRVKLVDPEKTNAPWLTIVGVIPNVQQDEVADELLPTIYLPLAQSDPYFMSVALRTSGTNPMQFAETLRQTVEDLDPDQPVYWVRTLQEWINIGRFGSSFIATLFILFAIVAVTLAAAGQYALLAYTVQQRTREIGVRRALGALDKAVVRLLLGQGIRQFLIALAVGLPIAFGFAFLLANQLFGVKPFDPITFVVIPVVLFLVSVLAGAAPAHRALKVDPVIALRAE
jgi:predicted permease